MSNLASILFKHYYVQLFSPSQFGPPQHNYPPTSRFFVRTTTDHRQKQKKKDEKNCGFETALD
jgi:hypothetical protein